MRIDNKTTWDTTALEVLIRAALADAGVKPGHDLVRIVYGRNGSAYHGWCYYGAGSRAVRLHKDSPRMRLTLPRDGTELVVGLLAYLVRHEVAHWAGLTHKQMSGRLMTPPKPGDTLPTWVPDGWRCARVAPPPKPAVDKSARRAERRAHLEAKVAEYERKVARTERLLAKWRKRLKAHDAYGNRMSTGQGKGPADDTDDQALRDRAAAGSIRRAAS